MDTLAAQKQTAIGLILAALIIGGWAGGHVAAVWVLVAWEQPLAALALFLVQTWLSVGLFIVAHDAMHGSLAPGRARLNRAVGRLALRLFMGFSYDRLHPKHHAHHDHVGSRDDPDFDADHPTDGLRWYWTFMRRYLDRYVFWVTGTIVIAYGAILYMVGGWERLVHLAFWAGPSLAASIQLFYFGTFRPHRHRHGEAFADHHNSRSNDFSVLGSLLSCFHFGYHHEHHLHPGAPWWRLPRVRARTRAS
ncbi:fatty acid desaturase [Sphingomicrobium astaxanthinifaciens]|uniref:fatty acid desaturase n=1 Tax=Sphingomicrobium astaxanthinifaciens TaxID=1227949 RepID=UPI001FCB9132|nr:fatty acid desaturase [Sphingomicrobium astaxanthinifaciens]MCJ7422409.1 fatty acid desaturase [Sphingomicrobium astaxanthinifaciens]